MAHRAAAAPPASGTAAAVIVAAGSGTRLPGAVPKPFLSLGGRWIVERTVAAFEACPSVARIVVVVADPYVEQVRTRFGGRVSAVVPGGPERRASVLAGLIAVGDADWVVVHDGVRPLVTPALIARVLEAAQRSGAATAGIPLSDTIKEVEDATVRRTVSRAGLWTIQTPQAFRADLLREAHRRAPAGLQVTDDAELVERSGAEVTVVPGDPRNIKVTTAQDLEQAAGLIGEDGVPLGVGIGYDIHRLAPDRPLVLGGVTIAHPRGLAGHSDADTLAHAVIDALLGAAGQRDIGHHFPPEDPAFRGADSMALLADIAGRLRAQGWSVVNVDAVILAEAPRLAPHIAAMRGRLADALGVDPGRVGVKATTGEGLGPIGRSEGIAAQAVALLRRVD